MRKLMSVSSALLIAVCCQSAAGARSNAAFVEVAAGKSSFWHTATNATLSLPVTFPHLATSASIAVDGIRYSRRYQGITRGSLSGGNFVLSLPQALSMATENVYDLTLSFDDGTVRTARLGLLCDAYGTTRAGTRCLFDASSSAWLRADSPAVLPIPYGVETIFVGGEAVPTGLDGRQGWYALKLPGSGAARTVAMTDGEADYEVALFGKAKGMMLYIW